MWHDPQWHLEYIMALTCSLIRRCFVMPIPLTGMTEKAEKASNGSTVKVLNCLHSSYTVHWQWLVCIQNICVLCYSSLSICIPEYIPCLTVPTSDIQMCTKLHFTFIYSAHTINCLCTVPMVTIVSLVHLGVVAHGLNRVCLCYYSCEWLTI